MSEATVAIHPKLKELEELLNRYETGDKAAATNFFNVVWEFSISIPKPQLWLLLVRMHKVTEANQKADPENFAYAETALGFWGYHCARYEESLRHFMTAQKMFSDLNHADGVAQCSSVIGATYHTLGDVELALRYLIEADEHLAKSNVHTMFLGFCRYTLAEMYSSMGKYDLSLRYHEFVLHEAEKKNLPNLIGRSLNGLGVVYQHQKKYTTALDYLQKALQINEPTDNLASTARFLTDLGNYYFELSDYEQALKFQTQALNIREEQNLQNAAATSYINIALVYIKQAKPDKALEALQKGLGMAERVNVKPKIYQIHQLLSEIYAGKGEHDKALSHFKAYHSIKEEVHHEDAEKKIKNIQTVFEAEHAKKENAIIRQQKAEIEQKNIELQNTIDELTKVKISRRAKAITLVLAVVLLVIEEVMMHFVVHQYTHGDFFISLAAKAVIVFSLKPIEKAIEHYLMKRIVLKKK